MNALANFYRLNDQHRCMFRGAEALSPSRRMFAAIDAPLRMSDTRMPVVSRAALNDLAAPKKMALDRMFESHPVFEPYAGGPAARTALDEAFRVRDLTRHALDLATRHSVLDRFMPEWPADLAATDPDIVDEGMPGVTPTWDELLPAWAGDFVALVRRQPRSVQLALGSQLVAAAVATAGLVGALGGQAAQAVSLSLTLMNLGIFILGMHEKDDDE